MYLLIGVTSRAGDMVFDSLTANIEIKLFTCIFVNDSEYIKV